MKTAFRRSLAAIAAAALATLTGGFFSSAQALTATVDVQQTSFSTFTYQSLQLMAQTFTAGASAQVVQVSMAAYTSGFYASSLSIAIEGVDSKGMPNGTPLVTPTTWNGVLRCCGAFYDFQLATPVPITKGTQYALVVTRLSGSTLSWYDTNFPSSGFTGGSLWLGCFGCSTWFSGGTNGADFAFKTWVATNVNQAPTLAADNAAVSVPEGTAPSDTGTYSDPDGDTVAVTASSGSLTRSGTSSGTWSWSEPAADEGTAQTVTITADDGHGLTASTSFSVSVTGVRPTAQIVNDPASVPEGTAVSLTGAATSPDGADNAAGFKYAWTVTKDGNAFGQSAGASFSFTPDDEGVYVVTLQTTDDGGLTGTSSLTVTGANVAPTATITSIVAAAPLVTTSEESITFGGAFSDPGVLDTHTATWNFGDGAVSTTSYGPGGSASLSASHSYPAAGTYTVTLTVADDDGGVNHASALVTVETPQQAIASIATYLQGLNTLPKGEQQSLLAKLDASGAALARGDVNAAVNELDALLNEVNADLRTGRMTTAQATTLRGAVYAVLGALGTYNRFLDWWPLAN